MSNLQMRLITAAFLIIISLSATWAGGWIFKVLILAIGAAIYHEWQMITTRCQTSVLKGGGWLCYIILAILLILQQPTYFLFIAILVLAIILAIIGGKNAGWIGGGLIYALSLPVTLALIRDGEAGLNAVLFLYTVVWTTDSAAYFSGRALGGPKLAPKISPNKTWSGAIGGTSAACGISLLVITFMPDLNLTLSNTLILALVLCIVSQMGDLGESWLKRHFNIKDSGRLLPGHGGFMDRADGLIAASVVFYFITLLLI